MKKFAIPYKSPIFSLAVVLLGLYATQLCAQKNKLVTSGFATAFPDPASGMSAPGIRKPAPDLRIAAAPQVSPTPLPAGSTAVVKTTVQNVGNMRAGFSVLGYFLSADAALSSDDVLLGDAITTALAPRSSLEVSTSFTVPAGTAAGSYHLLCVADYLNLVREATDSNNGWAHPLEVAPQAASAKSIGRTSPLAAAAATVPANRAEQLAGFDLSIAPNPVAAATPLHVQLSAAEPQLGSELALYNGLGQQVGYQALAPGRLSQAEFSTIGLAAGVYVLRLTGASWHATRRVVVK